MLPGGKILSNDAKDIGERIMEWITALFAACLGIYVEAIFRN
jgi:hypothetical protein